MDSETAAMLRDVLARKQDAVRDEDFERAKRFKQLETELRQVGGQLASLTLRKQRAVEAEEYDRAAEVKHQIDGIRSQLRQHMEAVARGQAAPAPKHPVMHSEPRPRPAYDAAPPPMDPYSVAPAAASSGPGGLAGRPPPVGAPLQAVGQPKPWRRDPPSAAMRQEYGQPASLDAPRDARGWGPAMGEEEGFFPEMNAAASNAPGPSWREQTRAGDSPAAPVGRSSPVAAVTRPGAPSEDRPIRPASEDLFVKAAEEGAEDSGGAPQGPPAGAGAARGGGGADPVELEGVPGVEDLPAPEQLKPSIAGEVSAQLDVFGEYLTRCLCSNTWQLRDAALQKIALGVRHGNQWNASALAVLRAAFTAIARVAKKDRIAQVFATAAKIVPSLVDDLGPELTQRQVVEALEGQGLFRELAEKLGDNGAKNRDAAVECLLALGGRSVVGPLPIARVVMGPVSKKQAQGWRAVHTRCLVLEKLVAEQALLEEGVGPDELIQFCVRHDAHKSKFGQLREAAKSLAVEVYKIIGPDIFPMLPHLRPKQKEEYVTAFQEATAADDAGGRQGPPAQAEPSPAEEELFDLPPPGRSRRGGGRGARGGSRGARRGRGGPRQPRTTRPAAGDPAWGQGVWEAGSDEDDIPSPDRTGTWEE